MPFFLFRLSIGDIIFSDHLSEARVLAWTAPILAHARNPTFRNLQGTLTGKTTWVERVSIFRGSMLRCPKRESCCLFPRRK